MLSRTPPQDVLSEDDLKLPDPVVLTYQNHFENN